ncbi:MAG: DUF4445 domain-containing protein [Betaproteobacteria bacterium]|nr:DUF4445 domain-containing protein [Betaproteobacteria bacterium]
MGRNSETALAAEGRSSGAGARRCTVTFAPGGRSARVAPGETLLAAAWKAGAGIKAVCGGRGKCGTCRIEIELQALSGGALSTATPQEMSALPEEFRGGTHRLACLAQAHADVAVSVPLESQAVKHPPRKPYTVRYVALEPLVQRVTIEVDAAASSPLRPLATRIAQALARTCGTGIGPILPRVLAEFSRRSGFDSERKLTVTLYGGTEVLQILPGERSGAWGVALDVGTTSLAMFLCNLATGDIVAVKTAANPQTAYGEDVISRMTHISQDPAVLATLQSMVVNEINHMIAEAGAESGVALDDILDVVAVGNPTMQHVLLGVNPEPIGRGPYQAVWREPALVDAADIGLRAAAGARLFVFPMVSGYIGGDTLAAVLTRGADFYQGVNLLIDVGTNGEVVLANQGELTATSCATGPVFEGAHIRSGVRASPGAIERVWAEPGGALGWAAISDGANPGDQRPIGLCGSGVISSVAALVDAGLVDRGGAFIPPGTDSRVRKDQDGRVTEAVLVSGKKTRTRRDIVVTQWDVRNVQLGKAALRAGIEILLREQGIGAPDRVLLAGAFGNHLDPGDIVRIGLVPPVPVHTIESIGNAAGDGARLALFSRTERERAIRLAETIRVIELTEREDFQDLFVECTALDCVALGEIDPEGETNVAPRAAPKAVPEAAPEPD